MIYQIAINIKSIEWIAIKKWSIHIYVYGMNSLTLGHSRMKTHEGVMTWSAFRTVGTYEETGGFPKKSRWCEILIFSVVSLNKLLNEQPSCRSFETPRRSCDVISMKYYQPKSQHLQCSYPDRKVYGADMGPTWGRQEPGGPHVGPMNIAIWV